MRRISLFHFAISGILFWGVGLEALAQQPYSGLVSVTCDDTIATADCDMLRRVAVRLVAEVDFPPLFHTWPPEFFANYEELHYADGTVAGEELTAYAHPCSGPTDAALGAECAAHLFKTVPHVHVSRRLFEELIQGNEDRLAGVVGHELAHITSAHTTIMSYKGTAETGATRLAFGRKQEIDADVRGLAYGIRAGYDRSGMLSFMYRFIEMGTSYSSLEGAAANHPSWEDRLAYVEEEREILWRSLGTFRNGVSFLATQQYALAEECFKDVLRAYPESYEAQANLGYALLMQYADALEPADLRAMGIGHVVVGSFVRRPRSMEPAVRGIDRVKWFQAVSALSEAVRLKPDLAEAKSNLGVAYMLAPAGKDSEKARRYLNEAVSLALADSEMDPRTRASIMINAGVADLGAGLLAQAEGQLVSAEGELGRVAVGGLASAGDVGNFAVFSELAQALFFNASMLHEEAGRNDMALQLMTRFLGSGNTGSAWWPLGYDRYARLSARVGAEPQPMESFAPVLRSVYRPISGIVLGGKVLVSVGKPLDEFEEELRDELPLIWLSTAKSDLVEGTGLKEFHCLSCDVKVVGETDVVSIALTGPRAPSLTLRPVGMGTESSSLSVGMPVWKLDSILKESYEKRAVIDPQRGYRFYRDIGLAVEVQDGVVREIVLTHIPVETLVAVEAD